MCTTLCFISYITKPLSGSSADVERTLKTLNGYHDDILEALRKAAVQRGISTPSGSTTALSEELLRRSIKQCQESYDYQGRSSGRGSKENICGETQVSHIFIINRIQRHNIIFYVESYFVIIISIYPI